MTSPPLSKSWILYPRKWLIASGSNPKFPTEIWSLSIAVQITIGSSISSASSRHLQQTAKVPRTNTEKLRWSRAQRSSHMGSYVVTFPSIKRPKYSSRVSPFRSLATRRKSNSNRSLFVSVLLQICSSCSSVNRPELKQIRSSVLTFRPRLCLFARFKSSSFFHSGTLPYSNR